MVEIRLKNAMQATVERDLANLRIVVTGRAQRLEVLRGHQRAGARHAAREAYCSSRLGLQIAAGKALLELLHAFLAHAEDAQGHTRDRVAVATGVLLADYQTNQIDGPEIEIQQQFVVYAQANCGPGQPRTAQEIAYPAGRGTGFTAQRRLGLPVGGRLEHALVPGHVE